MAGQQVQAMAARQAPVTVAVEQLAPAKAAILAWVQRAALPMAAAVERLVRARVVAQLVRVKAVEAQAPVMAVMAIQAPVLKAAAKAKGRVRVTVVGQTRHHPERKKFQALFLPLV